MKAGHAAIKGGCLTTKKSVTSLAESPDTVLVHMTWFDTIVFGSIDRVDDFCVCAQF